MEHSKNRGFTLIELLVVVLIIGILASVALPQYQKAVRKVRLMEVATHFNNITKGIDMWLMENGGYPSTRINFAGNGIGYQYEKLDIQQACEKIESYYCYNKLGRWSFYCDTSFCRIFLLSSYNADGTNDPPNKWLDEGMMYWRKVGDGEWGMENIFKESVRPEICRWWKGMGARVIDGEGTVSTACDGY